MDDVDILLWEWNLNVVRIERIVDDCEEFAFYERLLCHVNPCAEDEVYTAVSEVSEYCCNALLRAKSLYLGVLDSAYDKVCNLCRIAAVCYSEWNLRENVTMVTGQVLVVLCEELRVLERNDRAVKSLDECACV